MYIFFSKYTLFMSIHLFVLPSVMATVSKLFASAILFHTFCIDSKKIKWETSSQIIQGDIFKKKASVFIEEGNWLLQVPIGSQAPGGL